MPKTNVTQYDTTAANNTDVGGISIAEGMSPSSVNNAMRELMSHTASWVSGSQAVTKITTTGDIELGHASDTTLARSGSGDVTIEGNAVYRAGGTDVPVADGGTGASTLTDGGLLVGSGTGAITAMAVLADGEVIVGDGSTDPVAESGATLRTSIGVGTGDSPQFTGITLTGDFQTSTAGTSNLRLGVNAGDAIASGGNYNVVVGDEAGSAISTGDANVALGYAALYTNADGIQNIALGHMAMYTNLDGNQNVAAGGYALYTNDDGDYNTALGYGALYSNTSAGNNTATGYHGLYSNTIGVNNVATGFQAMYTNTEGNYNTASGLQALKTNSTGDYNTASGGLALYYNSTGTGNAASGYAALYQNSIGIYNAASGYAALYNNTQGNHNTATGYQALYTNSTGDYNTAAGSAALRYSTGDGNTAVGYSSGDAITDGTYNICIGYGADTGASNSNTIVLGVSITPTTDNQFTFGKASNVVQNEFDTDANWTRTSDVRKKRNIEDGELGLEFINDLRTVTHQWKPSNEFPTEWDEYSEKNNMNLDAVMHGMIAQEVKEALDKAGCDTFTGWNERPDGSQTVSREMFVIPLIKAVQELSDELSELKKKLE